MVEYETAEISRSTGSATKLEKNRTNYFGTMELNKTLYSIQGGA